MPRYAVRVIETQSVECVYHVDAKSPDEAEKLALKGETVDSYTVPLSEEIISRDVWDFPTEINQ